MDALEQVREQALVLRWQGGDEEAFVRLFERYHGRLKYYVRRLVDSPETADDVLQTVWLKALRGIPRLHRLDRFRPWLYRLARNEAFQYLRRDRQRSEVESEAQAPEEIGKEAELGEEDAAIVHQALNILTPPHREVLTLRFLEAMSYEEIASVVGCEVGTVRSRIHYAKRTLRNLLEGKNNETQR